MVRTREGSAPGEFDMGLQTIDLAIIGIYAVVIVGLAQWVSREKAGHEKDTSDYFLAGKALPWWAIGYWRLWPNSGKRSPSKYSSSPNSALKYKMFWGCTLRKSTTYSLSLPDHGIPVLHLSNASLSSSLLNSPKPSKQEQVKVFLQAKVGSETFTLCSLEKEKRECFALSVFFHVS